MIVLLASGCAHRVADDYPAYLERTAGDSALGQTRAASEYVQPAPSRGFSYEFRALSSGIANRWIVDIGQMLDDQLQSADVQAAFNGLDKVDIPNGVRTGLLTFELQGYDFDDFSANIALKVTYYNAGQTVLSKTYTATGRSQAMKMMLAGAFGQKNAVQQSTKRAIDAILAQLIEDLNASGDRRAR
ncbi:hypothetical protein T31B1_02875 [Salinisphaera sp. T31B1]